jgi:hypothetical protein
MERDMTSPCLSQPPSRAQPTASPNPPGRPDPIPTSSTLMTPQDENDNDNDEYNDSAREEIPR